MTRINTIPPELLTNEWLLAEWRELPRIVNELEKHPQRFKPENIPPAFTLNKGHVTYFRDKLLFLAYRHREIKRQLRKRGIRHNKRINVQLARLNDEIRTQACNDWQPQANDHELLLQRLTERFNARKKAYTFQGKKIDTDQQWQEYYNFIIKSLDAAS